MLATEPELNLGLTEHERETLIRRLGRTPNSLEWAMVDAEWSEHCSYKSSKSILKLLPTDGKHVLLGPGFDAGAVDVGDGYVVTIHIESHNHPSAVDPYGGAATGIGGVVRDILSIGTRPIALLDSLHFGDIRNSTNSRWLFKNVVKGISDYGNCIGVPTIGGEVGFDQSFEKNCLVDVVCIGLGKKGKMVLAEARNTDDSVILVGGSTGRDGIHGVTFASKVLSEEAANERSAVQIPSPFVKKLIIEATLEAVATGYVRGLKDLGGGGLTCGLSEMAHKGDRGIDIDFSQIPLRENDMTPLEALISESQERMLFVVEKDHEVEVERIFDKYELLSARIGRVTEKKELIIRNNTEVLANMPIGTIVEAPLTHRPISKPRYIDEMRRITPPPEPKKLGETLLTLLHSPTIASKLWVYEQYDHEVGLRTVVKPGQSGASVLRLDNDKLLAVTIDGNPKHCYIDPYQGAAGGLAEACRNIISVGGDPVAMVDHCQFGDPTDPEVFWTFSEAVRGMADYCHEMDLPCVGGKVSFYNEDLSNGVAIKPSPVVAVIGIIQELGHVRNMVSKKEDDHIVMLGATMPEMGGSEYYEYVHRLIGGEIPKVDFTHEKKLWKTVLEAIRSGIVDSANDCSEGGLAVALAEIAIASGRGIKIDLERVQSKCRQLDETLFSESHGRMLLSTSKERLGEIISLAERNDVPCNILGRVQGQRLTVRSNGSDIISLPLSLLEESWGKAISECMGEVV